MVHCILGLGSNDGDRECHLRNALNFLAEICETAYYSTDYESPALSGGIAVNKPHYLNSVAVVDFNGDLPTLEAMLKACEVMEGRTAAARLEGRVPLDIDIVVADGKILRPKDFHLFFFRRGYEELVSLLGPNHQIDV